MTAQRADLPTGVSPEDAVHPADGLNTNPALVPGGLQGLFFGSIGALAETSALQRDLDGFGLGPAALDALRVWHHEHTQASAA